MAGIHDFEMQTITGETVSLSDYAGKVCLIVNLATK
jgi:glutathione peroxidase-family protein